MHIIISDVGLYDYADSLRTNFARPVVRLKTLCVYTYIAMTDWWALLITCAWWTIRHRCAVLMASVQITSGPSTYNAVALCGLVNCLHAVWCVRTAFVAVCTCLKRYTRLYFWFKVPARLVRKWMDINCFNSCFLLYCPVLTSPADASLVEHTWKM